MVENRKHGGPGIILQTWTWNELTLSSSAVSPPNMQFPAWTSANSYPPVSVNFVDLYLTLRDSFIHVYIYICMRACGLTGSPHFQLTISRAAPKFPKSWLVPPREANWRSISGPFCASKCRPQTTKNFRVNNGLLIDPTKQAANWPSICAALLENITSESTWKRCS